MGMQTAKSQGHRTLVLTIRFLAGMGYQITGHGRIMGTAESSWLEPSNVSPNRQGRLEYWPVSAPLSIVYLPKPDVIMPDASDLFFEAYHRDDIAYGETPAPGVQSILEISRATESGTTQALDLGAGAGRDSIALAKAGFSVTSVDLSEMGLERINHRAAAAGVGPRIMTRAEDVRNFNFEPGKYDAIIATTVLDHIPASDAKIVWQKIVNSLTENGLLAVEVHSSEDPGSDLPPGCHSDAPKSETAGAVVNYFQPNQLQCGQAKLQQTSASFVMKNGLNGTTHTVQSTFTEKHLCLRFAKGTRHSGMANPRCSHAANEYHKRILRRSYQVVWNAFPAGSLPSMHSLPLPWPCIH